MRVYDLSVPVVDGVDWYRQADCPAVRVADIGSYARDGWRSHTVSVMVLNGTTYLETAAHIYEDQPTLDQIPPERFVSRAFVVKLEPCDQVLPAPEDAIEGFQPEVDSILLSCGWDRRMHARDYYHASPHFSTELQGWLLAHRPSILGGDMLSFDHPQDEQMPFVREFFRLGGMILCPLVGVEELPRQVTLCAAPMRLAGANAAPCRALAW